MKTTLMACTILLVLTCAQPLFADSVVESPSFTPQTTTKMPTWRDEVREILTSCSDTRAALELDFAAATSETEALAIQLRMQKLEESTELKIMNVQLVHLQRTGQNAEATALAAAIQEMKTPRPLSAPQDRSDRPHGQDRR